MSVIAESSQSETVVKDFFLTRRPCPQCGQKMRETDRVNESGFMYVWYECSGAGCDGQWLQKFTQVSE